MTWIYLNTAANVLIVMGLVVVAMASKRPTNPSSIQRTIRLMNFACWAFVFGATTEIAVASALYFRHLSPTDSDLSHWSPNQYLLAAAVGTLVWSALRRIGLSPMTEPGPRSESDSSALLGPATED
jgi:hypothetical protein